MEVVFSVSFVFFSKLQWFTKKAVPLYQKSRESPLKIFDTMFFLTPHNKGYGSTYTICVYRIR